MTRRLFVALLLLVGCGTGGDSTGRGPALGHPEGRPFLWRLEDDGVPNARGRVRWNDLDERTADAPEFVLPLVDGERTARVATRRAGDGRELFLAGDLEGGGDWCAMRRDGLFAAEVRTADGMTAEIAPEDGTTSVLRVGRRDDSIRCAVRRPSPGAPTRVRPPTWRIGCFDGLSPTRSTTIRIGVLYTADLESTGSRYGRAMSLVARLKATDAAAAVSESCRNVSLETYSVGTLPTPYPHDFSQMQAWVHARLDGEDDGSSPPDAWCVIAKCETADGAALDGLADDVNEQLAHAVSAGAGASGISPRPVCILSASSLFGEPDPDGPGWTSPPVANLAAHEIAHLLGCGHALGEETLVQASTTLSDSDGALTPCSHGAKTNVRWDERWGPVMTGSVMCIGVDHRLRRFSKAGDVLVPGRSSYVCTEAEDNVATIRRTAPVLARGP